MRHVDCLIVGAGFSGLTVAERLTTEQGKTCLLVEKRDHLGGNAYDKYDAAGVLVHAYGPHYFRTNARALSITSASSPRGIRLITKSSPIPTAATGIFRST